MHISGRRQRCNVALFDGEDFPAEDAAKHLVGSCGGLSFTLVSESYDEQEQAFIGEERCDSCGAAYLFSRRPTAAEREFYQAQRAGREERSTERKVSMFRENTALYLRGVYPTTETVDGETKKRVVLEWFVQPFTQELARSVDVAGNLFSRTDGDPIDDIVNCELAISVPIQQMSVRMAPDSPGCRIFENVRVSKTIKVRRDKEGPILAAHFKVDFAYPSPDDLLYLFTGYLDQHFVTFETQQGSLGLNEPAADAPPTKPTKQKPSGEEAAAG